MKVHIRIIPLLFYHREEKIKIHRTGNLAYKKDHYSFTELEFEMKFFKQC